MPWLGPDRPTYARATWWFLRLLGVVYLFAFWSLSTQILGLVAIAPDAGFGFGRSVTTASGLNWISGDAALQALCFGGMGLSALLIAGIAPVVMLTLLWLAYFLLTIACDGFLAYQWDALLLEVGFLAVFLAPWVWRERFRRAQDPPRLAVWLFLWLLFRLIFASGAAKLASGDTTWRSLTALSFHFETQPIPTPLAWYMHALPAPLLKAATALTLAIELVAPFLIIGPRRLRRAAFVPLVGLQVVIALTGNYAFFNLLTIALCLFLLDDQLIGGTPVQAIEPVAVSLKRANVMRARQILTAGVALATLPLSAFMFANPFGVRLPGAALVQPLADLVLPLRIVNRYGLFAVMTTTRPEIVVEGSEDGQTWREYEFRYKAGDVRRAPPWVAPHQPRLDWQMWFAALDDYDAEPWFHDFCARLLDANPAVLALLAHDPFDGRKPRFVRAELYRYTFSDANSSRRDQTWWIRQRIGDYSPVLTTRASGAGQ